MLELPPLPYEQDALEPHISAKTLSFHYGKHHKGYVDKANSMIEGTDLEKLGLIELIRKAAADGSKKGLFNNAAQIWNHDFYWHSMAPKGGGEPKGALAKKIAEDFGSFDDFKKAFKDAGAGQFGSGYAWLVIGADGKLKVYGTANAETPIADTKDVPLMTTDVWEHTYYLDYQNRRPDYLDVFLDKLVNWEFAEANFEKAGRQTA
ncbi:superoxide dismutase [Parvibaculum sp.]|jgi:superoxide dismutase, Fe-Mn family|uniref:superoxide dismutase n=1 Tax=Parvibaculum sp. TaxID=2024848 RepID=UPI000C36BF6D|nr:superoxide dismutase [Parvibaculum sp.]MAM95175.1 superoxide dismutase [Fe] [Parvibaculum sp.]HCX68916.1 superoxide dismutase [Fe] [Rhodobiaceae bacterium]|tara:strand:+ start:4894 stop:5511 length:618 start_codon:yes stop_codon:yes gene_type:complete